MRTGEPIGSDLPRLGRGPDAPDERGLRELAAQELHSVHAVSMRYLSAIAEQQSVSDNVAGILQEQNSRIK
jgi:hypothetical protein